MSNLRAVKRVEDLLKIVAASQYKERIKLLILSGGNFAPYRPLLKSLDIENQVHSKEYIFDIDNYLNASDLALYTSEVESFGLGALESMFYEKPVISTRTGGVSEVIEDGVSGRLFPVGDIPGLAAGLDELVEKPSMRRAMGEQAGRQARERFSSGKIVQQYLEFYEVIL